MAKEAGLRLDEPHIGARTYKRASCKFVRNENAFSTISALIHIICARDLSRLQNDLRIAE